MNIPSIPVPSGTPRVWDWYVPIVTTKNITHAYLTETIDEPSYYNELCYLLENSVPSETVYLHLNTPGGMIDSAFMLIDAIKSAQARVIGKLSGNVCSAGTLITMTCDEIEVADHTAFMVHNYSGGVSGKGHEMKSRQEFIDESLNAAFRSFYSGFLTENEMDEIIDGKDYWMAKDEVMERWAARKAFLAGKPLPRITDSAVDEDSTVKPKTRGRTRKA